MPDSAENKNGTTKLADKAREELKDLAQDLKKPQETQLWKSIFRVKHQHTEPRTRALSVLSNVFLHLHPARINRDAVRYNYTWGMGYPCERVRPEFPTPRTTTPGRGQSRLWPRPEYVRRRVRRRKSVRYLGKKQRDSFPQRSNRNKSSRYWSPLRA